MPVFDAFCITFGTAGTGGFGVRNDSIASYSHYVQWVVTVFMFLFGINFSCYYLILMKKLRSVLKDEELRLYFIIIGVSITAITVNLLTSADFSGMAPADAIRESAFHVGAIISSTGYSVSDFNAWPSLSKTIIVLLMCIGACAGSTGGGFKCARVLLLIKSMKRSLSQVLRPQKVKVIRVNDKIVAEKLISNTTSYLFIFLFILLVCTLLISVDGFSLETNFSVVLSCINNIGPGLDQAFANYADFSIFSKLILTVCMLAGRLELFPIILLFKREAWKR